jgi:hypothetical protein
MDIESYTKIDEGEVILNLYEDKVEASRDPDNTDWDWAEFLTIQFNKVSPDYPDEEIFKTHLSRKDAEALCRAMMAKLNIEEK